MLSLLCIACFLCKHAHAMEASDVACPWAEDGGKPIIDISLRLNPQTVKFGSTEGLGSFRSLVQEQAEGDICNESFLQLSAHTGTHIDAPSHFVKEALEMGKGVESLDLHILTGPVLVINVPDAMNISAAALEALHIPAGTQRVIFKTLNTKRGLMAQTAFDTTYTAVTADGAQWLIRHLPEVRLVGIDALSIAVFADLVGPHEVLLRAGLVAVEGLVLDDVAPGLYTLACLPLKLVGSDGAPARCILMP